MDNPAHLSSSSDLHFGYPCPFRHREEKMGARSAALADAKTTPFRGSVLCGNAQNPSGFPGKVFLDEDSGRYFLLSTSLTLVQMVHSEVVGLQTGTASEGTNFNTCRYRSPIENCFSLAGSGQVGLHRRQAEAILSLQAHALSGVGFLTLAF